MSLFDNLTNTKIEGDSETDEATQLIQDLLKVGAFEACNAKRNTFSMYGIISYARDLCKEIHALAKQADESDDVNDWAAYDSYTEAIGPLEQ